jgi:hypothetical protein
MLRDQQLVLGVRDGLENNLRPGSIRAFLGLPEELRDAGGDRFAPERLVAGL